jgi:hypothetical protein
VLPVDIRYVQRHRTGSIVIFDADGCRRLSAAKYGQEIQKRMQIWEDITGTAIAA